MRREASGVFPACLAAKSAGENSLRLGVGEALRVRRQGRVVGSDGPHLFEEGPPLLQRFDEGEVARDLHTGNLGQLLHAISPALRIEVHERVGPEGRPDPLTPALVTQLLVLLQGVGGSVSSAKHLDVEALEEGAGSKLGARELLCEVVIDPLRTLAGQLLLNPEDVNELVLKPETGWGAAEEVEVFSEALPDLAVICLDRGRVTSRHSEVLHRHAVTVEHAKDVMVGDDKELCGSAQGGGRVGEEHRRDVPMGTHERKVGHGLIKLAGHATSGGIWVEEAVGVEGPRCDHGSSLLA